MHATYRPRLARILATVMITVFSAVSMAESPNIGAADRPIVLTQASATTTPAVEHGHDASPVTPAIPDPAPRLNKKRVAFWGVIFMASTSVAFVIFGVWAMRRAPKPGQQRPG